MGAIGIPDAAIVIIVPCRSLGGGRRRGWPGCTTDQAVAEHPAGPLALVHPAAKPIDVAQLWALQRGRRRGHRRPGGRRRGRGTGRRSADRAVRVLVGWCAQVDFHTRMIVTPTRLAYTDEAVNRAGRPGGRGRRRSPPSPTPCAHAGQHRRHEQRQNEGDTRSHDGSSLL